MLSAKILISLCLLESISLCLGEGTLINFLGLFEPIQDETTDISDFSAHENEDQNFYPRRKRDAKETEFKKSLFLNNSEYDKEETPPTEGEIGTPVQFSVLIFSVREIQEILEEITIEMRLQIYWKDSRLKHWEAFIDEGKSYKSISAQTLAQIWQPDIFIDYVKAINQPKLLSTIPSSARYYRNGFLRISTRLTIKMACPMSFYHYPADSQYCPIDMKSYAYPNDKLALSWSKKDSPLVLLAPDLDLPNFGLALDKPETRFVNTSSGQSYSGVRFTVLLKRKLSYHFIQTYLPSTLFVCTSWLSFLVPPESVPGRMAICMTTLLSLATMFSGIRQNIPKVSYVKALDAWMLACVFFVFLTLVEYAIVLKLKSLIPKSPQPPPQPRKISTTTQPNSPYQISAAGLHLRKGSSKSVENAESPNSDPVEVVIVSRNRYEVIVETIEKYTWMIVIALFFLFNLIYWPWLLINSKYYQEFGHTQFYQESKK